MGTKIDRELFEPADYERFRKRLEECLDALGRLLARPGFGQGAATIGAELEVCLVDPTGRPLPVNQKVLAETVDERLTYELDRFNLECNLQPSALAGRPFAAMGAELSAALTEVHRAARLHGGRCAMIGILPTLRPGDLQPTAMSDVTRYRALSTGLKRARREPFQFNIDGADPLQIACDDVTFEGAATSLQIHLRVPPRRFARLFNSAQMATAPVLAAAGNSPTFLGHRLWEETRVALFKQSVDTRREVGGRRKGLARVTFGHAWVREGVLELFAELVKLHRPLLPVVGDENPVEAVENGRVPRLGELRVHSSTVWSWNRPVYDSDRGGHLRIEMRALPAGPTIEDMLANAAFLVGLTLGLSDTADDWVAEFPFEAAHRNFYRAAKQGLDAELEWPVGAAERSETLAVRDLIRRLLPVARQGLERSGVDREEAERLLGVIAERVTSGQTGAVWQRRMVAELEPRLGREAALAVMLQRYMERADHGAPVHCWPVAA